MAKKEKMKKVLSLLLSCAMCLSVGTACKEDNQGNNNSSVAVEESLELNETELFLTLGDKVALSASYNLLEGETLTWVSSSPSVVSVDENGAIEALKTGKATITASYGTKQVSCVVEVGLSGNLPVVAFENVSSDEITLMKNSSFDLGAYVGFNGKKFQDGAIEYHVSNESVGAIEKGVFTAKDVAGSTEVSVWATWRGQDVRVKTITINVIAEATVLLNGGKLTAFNLYMVENHEGSNYATAETINSVYVSEDGQAIEDYTLSILDEGIASIEKSGESWIVSSKKAGKTSLVVSYGEKEFFFDVTVIRPVYALNMTVDYSAAESVYFDETTQTLKPIAEMIAGFENLVSYDYNGKEYKIKDGALSLPEGEESVVTLYNDNVGYQVKMYVHTEIFDELQDFEKIFAGKSTTNITGYYMLAKDIIEPETVLTMPEGKRPNNFAGVFDGRGHTLSFTFIHGTQYRYGLFGQFLCGATIKNLALYNVTKGATTAKAPAGIICGEGSDGDASTPESVLENIFIDLKFSEAGATNLAVMGNAMWATALRNVIVHVPEVPVTETSVEYGSFARGEVTSSSNSYVISPAPLYFATYDPDRVFKVVPKYYASYQAMLSEGNDYTSFSVEYWDITTFGVPVWKSLKDVWKF